MLAYERQERPGLIGSFPLPSSKTLSRNSVSSHGQKEEKGAGCHPAAHTQGSLASHAELGMERDTVHKKRNTSLAFL